MNWKMQVKNAAIAVLIILFNQISANAQNLLNMQDWIAGPGSSGVFGAHGQASESLREWGMGPHGKQVLLWKATPDGNSYSDGGWDSSVFTINHGNMYRFTVWLKKTNSTDGTSYFGCGATFTLNGVLNDNAYFWHGDLPELNKWYLLVGYIHGSGDTSTVNYGGIYDGVTGTKLQEITDFKSSTASTHSNHRSYLYYDPNVNDRQYFYAPRVEMVNGDEPSIASLLSIQPSSSDQIYFSGKVGIKTQTPREYDLAVNGKIRSQEIKVEASPWPDYVFTKSYPLPTLQQTEKHIKEKGHLSGIPSAAEVKAHGIDLGEMNAKLLQKIEELTLHLVELNKRVEYLENENKTLRSNTN